MPRPQLRWNPGVAHALTASGIVPSAPSSVTSFTRDAGANIAFLAPASPGSGPVTSYTITPYIGASAQTPTTVAAGAMSTISGSDGSTYLHTDITGLANSTAYTFTVYASNAAGAGPESSASGANTPLAGLVFGDDFNGPANGPVHPEWWIYNARCGYLNQNEVQAYKADHCVLDGSSNLKLTAEHVSYTVPRYPSDPSYPGNVTQPWTSGACQGNTRTWQPSTGNTMTFEVRQQVCADAGSGFWPGLFWLEGQAFLTQWKTDPNQPGWDTGSQAEIDVAEWFMSGSPDSYGNNELTGGSGTGPFNQAGSGLSTGMHTYQAKWKPGVSTTWFRDGSQTATTSSSQPTSSARFFLLLYLQMLSGGPTTTESCLIDYVRVYDQNLG